MCSDFLKMVLLERENCTVLSPLSYYFSRNGPVLIHEKTILYKVGAMDECVHALWLNFAKNFSMSVNLEKFYQLSPHN